ncbi:Fpg/Nei family DNA glycosylase [Palleronia rufa]|uniref:Fpg/Nei family DNA glycosylase n=1 Tax=Palleronia rufa TaxID=1530186 RepID=UPI00055A4019|nr:DNA-formamidopyrimidine glycosylase family protein [Palleronia rufa]
MPELPEAESNRVRVESHCLNRTISAITLGETSHVDLPGPAARDRLIGRQFTRTGRHGKLIFAGSDSGPWIAVHLGMTGALIPFDAPADPPDHTRIVIAFEGDRRLAFRVPRKLGWMAVIDDPAGYVVQAGLGPDALAIDRDAFADTIGGTRGAIKPALMNQKKLAGIGNLWSDEALFQTGIDPDACADGLSGAALGALHDTVRSVLRTVCDAGADYGRLPGDWLIPRYRKEDASCPRCGGPIGRRKVGGRTAYFCTSHQG